MANPPPPAFTFNFTIKPRSKHFLKHSTQPLNKKRPNGNSLMMPANFNDVYMQTFCKGPSLVSRKFLPDGDRKLPRKIRRLQNAPEVRIRSATLVVVVCSPSHGQDHAQA